jgi:hypothetical protein
MTRDPWGFVDGPSPYGYVRNMAMVGVDPTGLFCIGPCSVPMPTPFPSGPLSPWDTCSGGKCSVPIAPSPSDPDWRNILDLCMGVNCGTPMPPACPIFGDGGGGGGGSGWGGDEPDSCPAEGCDPCGGGAPEGGDSSSGSRPDPWAPERPLRMGSGLSSMAACLARCAVNSLGSNVVNAIAPVDLLALDDSGWITWNPRPSLPGAVSLAADATSFACHVAAGKSDAAAGNARDGMRVSKGKEKLKEYRLAVRASAQAEMFRRLAGHAKRGSKAASVIGFGIGLEIDRARCEEICGRGSAAGRTTE